MVPIENEPKGWNENQKRNNAEIDNGNNDFEKNDTDELDNDIAGNASGNLPVEEDDTRGDVSANDGKGFLGDFAKPQHED